MQAELNKSNNLERFDETPLHPKNKILKEDLLTANHWICMERAKYYTESFKRTNGEYPTVRVAKALRHTFNKMTVKIYPHEILVGNRSSKLIAPPIAPERGDMPFVIETMLSVLKKRQGYHITKEHKRWLSKDIIPYWEDKSVRSQKVKKFEEANLASQLKLKNGGIKRLRKAFGFKNITRLVIDPN
ncbi:MAG: pyruvate formate lyase family protein, partial [Promethearchaeia archaeon]